MMSGMAFAHVCTAKERVMNTIENLISYFKESIITSTHPSSALPSPPPRKSTLPPASLHTSLARSLGFKQPSVLSQDRRQEILEAAHNHLGTPYHWGWESSKGLDCSHFVHRAYQEAGFKYPYTTTHGDWQKAGFEVTNTPKPGDLILWDGHMGIVVDPEKKIFIGAQKSTGVAQASYKEKTYWGTRSHIFLTSQALRAK